MQKIKRLSKWFKERLGYIRQILCRHKKVKILRWRWMIYPEWQPKHIVAVKECEKCGKIIWDILLEDDAEEFDRMMGEDKYDITLQEEKYK